MANPPKPLTPNITTGAKTGRVATDRYDFESHITGGDFRHIASQIDLSPAVSILSVDYTNAQAALIKLAELTSSPTIPDATISIKGIVKLAGDLGGSGTTALLPRVSGLQGRPVNTLVPTTNQILTWDGYAWGPVNAANGFIASGDLSGNSISQQVIRLTGVDGDLIANDGLTSLIFTAEGGTVIKRADAASADDQDFFIKGQRSTENDRPGGDVYLLGGQPGTGGLKGEVHLVLGHDASTAQMVHLVEPAVNRKVLGLVSGAPVTSTNMPANTGDRVIFIAEAATAPTTGIPSGGAILYAKSDGLWAKTQDGSNFNIAPQSNPRTWGTTTGQVIESRYTGQSISDTPALLYTQNLADSGFVDATFLIEATFIARDLILANGAYSHTVHTAFMTNASTPTELTGIALEEHTNGSGGGVSDPTITIDGTNLKFYSGFRLTYTFNWFLTIKITIFA